MVGKNRKIMKFMANNRKEPKKCHFDLREQNNDVSINQKSKRRPMKTYGNIRLAAARL